MGMNKAYIILLISFIALSTPSLATDVFWDSDSIVSAGQLASNATNWNLDVAPVTGDNVIFNGSSVQNCSWNLGTITLGSFYMASTYNGTDLARVNLISNLNSTGDINISGGTFSINPASYWVNTSGNFNYQSGAVSSNQISLNMSGSGKTLTSSTSLTYLGKLYISDDTNVTSAGIYIYANNITIASGKTMTIASGKRITFRPYAVGGSALQNYGNISGGTLAMITAGTTPRTIKLGNLSSEFTISVSWGTSTTTLLGENTLINGNVTITGWNTTNQVNLSTGTYQFNVTGILTIRNATINQGSNEINIGSFAMGGANDVSNFSQGTANVTFNGNVARYNGSLSGDINNYIIMHGNWSAGGTGTTMTASSVNVIFNGTNRWLTEAGASPFRYLEVAPNSVMTSNSTIQTDNALINGNLTLNNYYNLTNANITLSSGGYLNVLNASITNGIMNGTTFYMNSTNTTLEYLKSNPTSDAGLYSLGHFINVSKMTSTASYGLNMSYVAGDYGSQNESNIRLYIWDGSSWSRLASSVDASNNFVEAYAQTGAGVIGMFIGTPVWSNNISYTPTSYNNTTLSRFNITWQESPHTVFFESNFSGSATNYSMTNTSFGGSIYNFTMVLPAGTFYWKSYANDTLNVWNASDTWYFGIGQALNTLNFSSDTGTRTYPNTTSAYCYAYDGTPQLYRGALLGKSTSWVNATNNTNETMMFGVGSYRYMCNVSDNTNYTGTTQTEGIITIVQNTSLGDYINLTINGTENDATYLRGQVTNMTAWTSFADLTFNFYRNDTLLGTGTPQNDTDALAVGDYVYYAGFDGDANYSGAYKQSTLSIKLMTITPHLSFNGTEGNKTYHAYDYANITAWSNITGFNITIGSLAPFWINTTNETYSNDSMYLGTEGGVWAFVVSIEGNISTQNETMIYYLIMDNSTILNRTLNITIYPNPPYTTRNATFYAKFNNSIEYIFSWNRTGSWENDTTASPSGTWTNATKYIYSSDDNKVIGFRIYATDGHIWDMTEGIATAEASAIAFQPTSVQQDYMPYIISTLFMVVSVAVMIV